MAKSTHPYTAQNRNMIRPFLFFLIITWNVFFTEETKHRFLFSLLHVYMSNSGNNLEARIHNLLVPPPSVRTRQQKMRYLEWARRRVEQLRNLQRRARRRKTVTKPKSPNKITTGRTRSRSARTPSVPTMNSTYKSGSNNLRRLYWSGQVTTPANVNRLIHLYVLSHRRHR